MPLLFQTTGNHYYFAIHIFLCSVCTVIFSIALDLTESSFNTDSSVSAAEFKKKSFSSWYCHCSAPIKIETPRSLPPKPGKSRAFGNFLFLGNG